MNKIVNQFSRTTFNSLPVVSIILTVYNRASYLKRCINSVLNQSLTDWELIAIDDGSTDNSLEILKDYENYSENITVVSHANMKLPLSRNKGINLSLGKYITFIDSDDRYEKEHLAKRLSFMMANPDVDLIYGGVKIIGDQYVRDKDNPTKFIHLSKCTVGATFFGKSKVFIELNGFKNLPYSEDSEFLNRTKAKFKVQEVNFKTYVYHRDVLDSITNTYMP